MDDLLARSSEENWQTFRHVLMGLVIYPVTAVVFIVAWVGMVIVGGFIISLFTNALFLAWQFVFGH